MDAKDLTWNARLRTHEVTVRLPGGGKYRLHISGSTTDDRALVLDQVRARAAWVEANIERVREGAGGHLLDLYNETWRDPGEDGEPEAPVLDLRGFADRLKLAVVTVYEEGTVTLYFDDDGMFCGHTIEVDISPEGEVEDGKIVG